MYRKTPNQIYIPIKVRNTVQTEALIDSGASSNFISRSFARKNRFQSKKLKKPIEMVNIDNTPNKIGKIEEYVEEMMTINSHEEKTKFYIADIGDDDIILGIQWLKIHNPEIDWTRGTIHLKKCTGQCRRNRRTQNGKNEPLQIKKLNEERTPQTKILDEEEEDQEEDGQFSDEIREYCRAGSTLSTRIAEKTAAKEGEKTPEELVPKEFHGFLDVFSKEKSERMPTRKPYDLAVNLEKGKKPPKSKLYPLSPKERETLKEWLTEEQRKGYIRKSNSEYAAPFFYVKKKDGKLRPVQDYRRLNDITIKDRFPIPLSKQLLDRISKAKIFTTLDVRWGYNNVRIKEGDEHKLAFTTEFGLFEPTVMYFGMSNAPATFQRFMNEIFEDITNIYVIVYLDDIFIFSNNREEHIQHVKEVLRRLQKNDLFLKPEKCSFFQEKVNYLGHVVSEGKVEMDQAKVEAILEWPTPKKVKEVQSFLGFANFYRRFIKDFSKMSKPLTMLVKKEQKWIWGDAQEEAFKQLKNAFSTTPILTMPDPGEPFILECDASDFATGAILSQKGKDGKMHPIAFYSKGMAPAERNYEIYDKELLAIIRALEEWRHYLEGADYKITILSDHQNLQYFATSRTLTRRQARWSLFLTRFDFEIKHRPGRLGGKPDILSRRVDHEPEGEDNTNRILLGPEVFKAKAMKRGHGSQINEHPILKRIRSSNERDDEVQKAYEAINLKKPRKFKKGLEDWNTEDGLILYKGKVYVPKDPDIRKDLVQLHHDSKIAGHNGIFKTIELISRNYWWPGMTSYIKNYVNTCDTCNRKKKHPKKKAPLQTIPTEDRPWEVVTNDFIVQLPKSKGYDAIWVVADHTLKEAHFVPVKSDINAEQTVDLYISHIWKLHGLPKKIISDRGPQFTSKLVKGIFKRLGIEGATSTAYHPQTDGQSERINQELEQYLRNFCNYRQNDWADYVALAEFAYNNRTHSTTQHSPFYASRGYHPNAIITGLKTSDIPRADELIERIQTIQDEIKSAQRLAHETVESYYDRGTTLQEIQEGDKVWLDAVNVKTTAPSKKLADKYLGPYKVKKKISAVNYELDLPDTMMVHPVFHINLLRKHQENSILGRIEPPPPPIEVEGEEEYEVEEILDGRLWRNQKQYLVKWEGYDTSENSWQTIADLKHAQEAIQHFHDTNPDFTWKTRKRPSSKISGGS